MPLTPRTKLTSRSPRGQARKAYMMVRSRAALGGETGCRKPECVGDPKWSKTSGPAPDSSSCHIQVATERFLPQNRSVLHVPLVDPRDI